MRIFLSVKNVTINALQSSYGTNIVPHENTIGNIWQRPQVVTLKRTFVSSAAKHTSSGQDCGAISKNVERKPRHKPLLSVENPPR